MYSYKTRGIVVRRTNFGEADRILTIITEDLGKIKAIAKGVRKISAKMAGSLEPYNLVQLGLHSGKTFYTVTGAQNIETFENLQKSNKKFFRISVIGELSDVIAQESEKSRKIFELLLSVLRILNSNDKSNIVASFEIKIMEEAGYKPELKDCALCKGEIKSGEVFWSGIAGGVVCGNCAREEGAEKISDEAIKMLRFMEKNCQENCVKLKFDQKVCDEIDNILVEYIQLIIDRELKSGRYL